MIKLISSRSNGVLNNFPKLARNTMVIASLVTLAACSSSDSDTDDMSTPDSTATVDETMTPEETATPLDITSYAFAAMRSSDYASGRIDRISLDENTISGSYPATLSDIAVTTDDTNVYQIGRFGIDSITRFDATDTSTPDYQISVNDQSPAKANPYSLAFLTESKAYLTRYGSTELWIIDPRGETEGSFKTGGIDLSAYDADEPNMSDAILIGDKLFVLLERLTAFSADKSAYLAVIDTSTDTEIVTNETEGALPGIELAVKNPTALQYNAETNEIFVVGRGSYFPDENITGDTHTGGVEVIDPDTYQTDLLIDDGTDADNQGYFIDAVIVSADLGYLLTYAGFGNTTLRTFNPTLGNVNEDLIGTFQNVDITVLAQGTDNHLWVGITGEQTGFYRIDLATGVIADEIVATELVPIGLTFVDVAAQ